MGTSFPSGGNSHSHLSGCHLTHPQSPQTFLVSSGLLPQFKQSCRGNSTASAQYWGPSLHLPPHRGRSWRRIACELIFGQNNKLISQEHTVVFFRHWTLKFQVLHKKISDFRIYLESPMAICKWYTLGWELALPVGPK